MRGKCPSNSMRETDASPLGISSVFVCMYFAINEYIFVWCKFLSHDLEYRKIKLTMIPEKWRNNFRVWQNVNEIQINEVFFILQKNLLSHISYSTNLNLRHAKLCDLHTQLHFLFENSAANCIFSGCIRVKISTFSVVKKIFIFL